MDHYRSGHDALPGSYGYSQPPISANVRSLLAQCPECLDQLDREQARTDNARQRQIRQKDHGERLRSDLHLRLDTCKLHMVGPVCARR